ncbi:RES family NAD+ phosphorylase [Niallia taxi]|nr:RES family NAD+ phosphorylase [Niallia taxi]MDE5055225.1 RES family NAD+ phosphorylase [Niallia taxi]
MFVSDDIVCKNCIEKLNTFAQKLDIQTIEYEVEQIPIDLSEQVFCELCGIELFSGAFYIDKFTRIASYYGEQIGEKLSINIGGCFNCEGHNFSRLQHLLNKDETEQNYDLNMGSTVEEYLSNFEMPDDFQVYITQHLKCKCGFGGEYPSTDDPHSGMFDIYDDIYTIEELNSFYDDYKPLQNLAELNGFTLSEVEFDDFKKYLLKYPLLAYKHPTGSKLYSILQTNLNNKVSTLTAGTTLYRGRPEIVNNCNEMWEPPVGVSNHGRFNSVGRSVLYCADDSSTIPMEINITFDEEYSMAEVTVLNDLQCLDITDFHLLTKYFHESVPKDSNNKIHESYLIPNYIAECCYELGYKGVKYESVQNKLNFNYALFNYEREIDLVTRNLKHVIFIDNSNLYNLDSIF